MNIDQDQLLHYRGTPYCQATVADVMPSLVNYDDRPLWFAFTPNLKKITVGGVETEAKLKAIIDASDKIEATLNII